MSIPRYAQLEPVGQCNLRCQMCPIQFRRDGPPYGPPAFMDYALFERILDELAGLEELHLQGLGEPMMHPRFFDMVDAAAARGIRVTTNSNLTLVNPARAERCVTGALDTLHVSIDAATAAVYERIRVRARLERVLRNVDLVRAARRAAGTGRPRLRLVMVLMRQNLEELPAVVQLAAARDFESVWVQHLCHDFAETTLPAEYAPMRAFVDHEMLSAADELRVSAWYQRATDTALAYGIELRLPSIVPREHPPGTPGRERCDWPWKGPYISYQGYAMPCCMIATPDRGHLGEVRDRGVLAVWNGPEYEAFRARLDSGDPPEICKTCSVYRRTF